MTARRAGRCGSRDNTRSGDRARGANAPGMRPWGVVTEDDRYAP